MIYYLLSSLQDYFSPLNVVRYITFRTAYASLTALLISLLLGPWVIRKLRDFQIGQFIRAEGPATPPGQGGDTHHGRAADHHQYCPANPSLG